MNSTRCKNEFSLKSTQDYILNTKVATISPSFDYWNIKFMVHSLI
jgi:hypothetical protein